MSGHDYIKFLTAEMTAYINLPTHVKKERKIKRSKPPYGNQWFGMLPFMFKIFFHKGK